MTLKTCPYCHEEKEEQCFQKGYRKCKSCRLSDRRNVSEQTKEHRKLSKKEWDKNNKDKARNNDRKRYYSDPAKYVARAKARRMLEIGRMPKWADAVEIEKVYRECRNRRDCGEDVVVDHIVPLRAKEASGLHVHFNLQIVSREFNDKKGNKMEG